MQPGHQLAQPGKVYEPHAPAEHPARHPSHEPARVWLAQAHPRPPRSPITVQRRHRVRDQQVGLFRQGRQPLHLGADLRQAGLSRFVDLQHIPLEFRPARWLAVRTGEASRRTVVLWRRASSRNPAARRPYLPAMTSISAASCLPVSRMTRSSNEASNYRPRRRKQQPLEPKQDRPVRVSRPQRLPERLLERLVQVPGSRSKYGSRYVPPPRRRSHPSPPARAGRSSRRP